MTAAATATAENVTLDLTSDGRRLSIRLKVGECVWAGVYREERKGRYSHLYRPLATSVTWLNAQGNADQFSIRFDAHGAALWVAKASFPVTAEEAERIEATYSSHGLEIHRPAKETAP